MIAIKTLIFTVIVPGTITLWLPRWLLSSAPASEGNPQYVGAIPILIGAAIYFWCAWDFTFAGKGTPAPIDPPKQLVMRGLYRYVRNPMYVGVLLILLGEAVLFESRVLFAYAGLVFLAFYLFVLVLEEPILKRKFGASYEQYYKLVPRWIPRTKRLTAQFKGVKT